MNLTKERICVATVATLAVFATSSLNAAEATVLTSGEGIEWFAYRSNATPGITYENGTTTITNLDSSSYVWGYLPQGVQLSEGEQITLSGTATFTSVTSSGVFYFGLFNSGTNTKPASGTTFSSISAGTNSMTGFFAGTKTDGSATTVYSRFNEREGYGFMTTNQGGSYITSSSLSVALTAPTAGEAYAFELVIAMNWGGGYTITLTGGEETVTFSVDESLSATVFDVIGFKSPGSGIVFSDLSITTTGTIVGIPEPGTFGVFSALLLVAVCLGRRRRGRAYRY